MDAGNEFLVNGAGDGSIGIGRLSPVRLSRELALNLAAWLVALADRDGEFEKLLEEVKRS